MIEGWHGDDHLILFDEAEIASASEQYGTSESLPGHEVIGLRGWDDFILRDPSGTTYCAPTVPAVAKYLSPYSLPSHGTALESDDRFCGKIKWYLKPLIFGGDPQLHTNMVWITHEQHAQLVKYWNALYRSVKGAWPMEYWSLQTEISSCLRGGGSTGMG